MTDSVLYIAAGTAILIVWRITDFVMFKKLRESNKIFHPIILTFTYMAKLKDKNRSAFPLWPLIIHFLSLPIGIFLIIVGLF